MKKSRLLSGLLASFLLIGLPLAHWGCGDNNVTVIPPAAPPAAGTAPPSPTPSPTSSASESPTVTPIPEPTPVIVNINITQIFKPAPIIIKQTIINQNITVVIVNNSQSTHSVVADNGDFDSGPIPPGQSRTVTPRGPGEYPFHCGVHPSDATERGVLRVEAGDQNPEPTPSASPGTVTPTPSPTPVITTATPEPSPSATPTPSVTSTPSPSPTASESPSPSPSPTPTTSPTPSISPSPSITTTASAGYTPRPMASAPGLIIIQPEASQRGTDAFAAGPITISADLTVISIFNNDTVTHTATADDGSWDTGDIAPGETARLNTRDIGSGSGDFAFHCRHHPSMKGVLQIERPETSGGGTPTATPETGLSYDESIGR